MFKFLMRRHYIVDWKLQGSLVKHGLLYGALVLVVVVVGMFAPLLFGLGGETGTAAHDEQSIVMLYLHERFWPLALLCALVVAVGAIRFSHRIAGPMVRFKRNLRLLATGKLATPLRTRPGDYLQEEVNCLNAAIAGVRQRTMAARQAAAQLQRRLRADVAAEGADPGSTTAQELADACDELLAQLDEFVDVDPDAAVSQPTEADTASRPVLAGHFEP